MDPGASSDPVGLIATLVVVAALVIAAVLLLRRFGLIRRGSARSEAPALLDDPSVPPRVLRDRARDALESGDHDLAAVLALRALVRDLSERTLLDASAGLTAREAAERASESFAQMAPSLSRVAAAFDTAAYSRRHVSAARAREAVQLADFIAQTRPDPREAP